MLLITATTFAAYANCCITFDETCEEDMIWPNIFCLAWCVSPHHGTPRHGYVLEDDRET